MFNVVTRKMQWHHEEAIQKEVAKEQQPEKIRKKKHYSTEGKHEL